MHSEVDGEVFVFGPDLQLDENGMVIPECDRKYIWVPEILKQLHHNVNAIQILPSMPTQNVLLNHNFSVHTSYHPKIKSVIPPATIPTLL